MKKITRNMIINDILEVDGRIAAILMQHGMHCVGCGAAKHETLVEACAVHGMGSEECDKMVDGINSFLEQAVPQQ